MTLNEFITEEPGLTPNRKLIACRRFLKQISELNDHQIHDIYYSLSLFMEDLCDLEDDDFFGTEGMDI